MKRYSGPSSAPLLTNQRVAGQPAFSSGAQPPRQIDRPAAEARAMVPAAREGARVDDRPEPATGAGEWQVAR